MHSVSKQEITRLVKQALDEDIGAGDATSQATIKAEMQGGGRMVMAESAVLCGLHLAEEVFREVAPQAQIETKARDGQSLLAGEAILEVHGPVGGLLSGERTALNFVQRLSGIATLTSRFVEAVQGTGTVILDTRKTTPGWRQVEKYAVTCGGGRNHRVGLYDMIMVKDNHLAALAQLCDNPVEESVRKSREQFPDLKVEVEADTLKQVEQALAAGADIILLDNMNLDELRAAVKLVQGKCQTEASGGVSLATVRSIAETGVDFISVGALTHSSRAIDIGMEVFFDSSPSS